MIRCVAQYINDARGLRFQVGQVFDPDPALRAYLMADAPGCFEAVDAAPAVKAPKKPAADKAVHEAAQTK